MVSHLRVGFAVGIIGCLWAYLTTEFLSTSLSTLAEYLYLFWVVLHLPLHLILIVLNPPRYLDPLVVYLAVFVQWFLVGQLGYWIYTRKRRTALK
jgi:hypothetical protein